ncbi:glycerate kinase [Blastococcus sp. BMG 814]|uniref:Glycerate kinase n=1 Tax=Blastococcus carthaginiensis TaxID=3050034 RepID=A0ABT9II29_9ACTN|nr:glycerate kinase [Blastococcus carthaginiensis]MDP5185233.1 glycerate kinase [Blastococcus carthaginiensis]
MHVVIAPDSFKGSLAADRVAEAVAEGVLRARPDAEVVLRPVADGGEGTVAAALRAGYRPRTARVSGPDGRPVDAVFAVDGTTAVLELASAAGLGLLERPAPLTATTYGVGELVRAALDAGARRVVLGAGGSATTDGGAGLLQALGVRLLDAEGSEVPRGGAGLARLDRIDVGARDPRLHGTELVVGVDVDNPLTGPEGAAAVFGPQKGATPEQIAVLDGALTRFAAVVRRDLGVDLLGRPAMGAAGGTAGGLAATIARGVGSGARYVCDLVGLDAALTGAALAITGEGSLDEQTLRGKAPAEVAARAAAAGVPCLALAGAVRLAPERLRAAGFVAGHALTEVEPDVRRCLAEAPRVLAELAARVVRAVLPPGASR